MKDFKKKLALNKRTITNLNEDQLSRVVGGNDQELEGFTGGCTDGCGGSALGCTMWNCTEEGCSNDCYTVLTM